MAQRNRLVGISGSSWPYLTALVLLSLGLAMPSAVGQNVAHPTVPVPLIDAISGQEDGVTAQGGGCPKLSGISGTDSQILYTFTWINNACNVPIRKGLYLATGFGWDHITHRRVVDKLANHETTSAARQVWAAALLQAGSIQKDGLYCHSKHYKTPGGTKRTMKVVLSPVNYAGKYGTKGIITAFWTSGWVNPCS
ncbi:MAG: hypothetical protein ACT4OM_10520 [Actinomycetota bacterium]